MNEPVPHRSDARPASRMEAMVRLSTPNPDRSATPLPDLVPYRKLTSAQQKRSIDHLYAETLSKRREKLEKLEKDIYDHSSDRILPPDEISSIIQRLFEEGVKNKEKSLQSIATKRLAKLHIPVKIVESKDELNTIVMRLYNTAEKERSKSADLFRKYNPQRSTNVKTKEEVLEMADRFYKGGFGKKM
jgi:exonuclease VII large subunit